MYRHIRNHRHAIRIETKSGELRLLTIGYVAVAVHRTRWTVLHWEQLGLLPPAPFVMMLENSRLKRRLYPETFVGALAAITEADYLAPRMEREEWGEFQMRVLHAYACHVTPLLEGVIPPIEIESLRDRHLG